MRRTPQNKTEVRLDPNEEKKKKERKENMRKEDKSEEKIKN